MRQDLLRHGWQSRPRSGVVRSGEDKDDIRGTMERLNELSARLGERSVGVAQLRDGGVQARALMLFRWWNDRAYLGATCFRKCFNSFGKVLLAAAR